MRDLLVLLLVIATLTMVVSFIKMDRYIRKLGIFPHSRVRHSFMGPFKFFMTYIEHTKAESGCIGIWLKIFIVSAVVMVIIGNAVLYFFGPLKWDQ